MKELKFFKLPRCDRPSRKDRKRWRRNFQLRQLDLALKDGSISEKDYTKYKEKLMKQ